MKIRINLLIMATVLCLAACGSEPQTGGDNVLQEPTGSVTSRGIITENGTHYVTVCNVKSKQQEWERLVFEKEELELKIGKEHVGEKIENHIDEDAEYTFSIYNIKGKEGSEVKIFKQPGREYIYVIPHDEYVKYEEAEKNERK